MRVISKKISYNGLTSKLPGIIPSIMNSWEIPPLYNCGKYEEGGETFFSHESAVKRASQYNINASQLRYKAQFVNFDKNNLIEFTVGNFGLIPSDVIIPRNIANKITDYTDIYVNLPDGNGGFYDLSWPKNPNDPHYEGRKIISGGTEIKVLTYYTLNKWYSFFRQYYELVNHPSYPRIYDSAIDYYNKEFEVKNEEREAYYKNMDDVFISRGGRDMYDWISNNCIIQYKIPEEFSDEWNTTYLYYPDAIKWYYWFKKRSENYEYVHNIEDCHLVDLKDGDCCDCVEFVKRGGHAFYNGLKAWVDSVNINPSFATNSASITIPISITNSIDDLGEMAILSSKWKEERDYHNTLNNTSGGTSIERPHIKYFKCKQCGYEGPEKEFENNSWRCPSCLCNSIESFDATLNETYMIKGGVDRKGYEYNKYYENEFKWDNNEGQGSDWVNYTDYYIDKNPKEFVTLNENREKVTAFTYSPINGKIIYNPTDSDLTEKIAINNFPVVCINGNTYEVIDGKYVELCYSTNAIANLKYKKRTKLQIFKNGDLEYAVLNGKRKYVEVDPIDPVKERIYFLRESNCYDEGCYVQKGKYIIYDNCLYLVENNKIVVDNDGSQAIYPVLDGYFDIKDNRFYISGNSVVIQNEYEYNENSNIYDYKFRPLDEYDLMEFNLNRIVVSGDKTYVTLFYMYERSYFSRISGHTDSKLDGLRRKEISTDDLGNELPGYFKSIVDIDKGNNQSRYNLPYDECTLDILYKVGEVSDLKPIGVSKTRFLGNMITNIKFYYADEFRNPIISYEANNDDALDAIRKCETDFINSNDERIIGVMLCDITYYMGCVINKNGNKYEMNKNTYNGVKYIDTVYVTKQVGTYYLNNDRQFTFKYYLLTQDVETLIISDLNADVTWDISTYFEYEPMLYLESGMNDSEMFSEFDKNNGIIVSPVFRNEFNLASSLPQNVEADIYIDRGISAAFEKQLKLQEFRTMEALENYGNGWFKINEY